MSHPPTHSPENKKAPRPDKTREKQNKKQLMTDDEKIDEASRESMDASDPPAYISLRTGAPPQRKQ
jgi:hypothetical protein